MKKIMMLTGAGIILFCIVSISTTQAMQNRAQEQGSIASDQPDAVLSVFNQKELRDIIVELGNPKFKAKSLADDIKELRGAVIAKGGAGGGASGKSKGSGSLGNNNQNVDRRGYGRSTMGDEYDADDDTETDEEELDDDDEKDTWGDAEYPED